MDEAMRFEDLGLQSVPDKKVCLNHFDQKPIKKFIRRNADMGYCDYCNKNKYVIALEDLMIFMMEAVQAFYTDPANFMSYNSREGGYLGNVYDSSEILQEHFGLEINEETLFNDIFDSLDYSKGWANEMEYYDSPSDKLLYSWKYFKQLVKNRSRYFFGLVKDLNSEHYLINSNDMLKEIGDSIKKFNLINVLPAGIVLYRCRQHKEGDLTVTTPKGMTSPPDENAVNANRMSPAGISMFYGAFQVETSLAETLDYENNDLEFCTTAGFITNTELTIIDLSALPDLPSPFDQKKLKDYYRISFMRDFVKDLMSPIKRDGRVHIDYVPTQVVTEYFRFPFSDKLKGNKRIHGIVYPSSKNGKKACVLFFDNTESLEVFEMDEDSLQTNSLIYF